MTKKTIAEKLAEIGEQVKEMFKFADTPEPGTGEETAPKSKEYSLADGKKVSITELKEGGIVSIKDAADVETPHPAGDITLMDGTVITVGEAGAITAIKAPELSPEENMQQMREAYQVFADPASTPEQKTDSTSVMLKALMNYCFGWDIRRTEEEATKQQAISAFQTMKSQDEKKDKAIAELKQTFAEQLNKQNETIAGLVSVIQELSEMPGAPPLETKNKNRQEKNDQKKGTLQRRMEAANETTA